MKDLLFWVATLVLLITPVSAQVVNGFAEITVCDIQGTNAVLAEGLHAVDEYQAPSGHSHTQVEVQGVIRKYSSLNRCNGDTFHSSVASCFDKFTEVNGEDACNSTYLGPSCVSYFRAKVTPKHIPTGGATNEGIAFSPCASADCEGDFGCNPFTGFCP